MWSAAISPATIAAALEPSPRASGICEVISKRMPSAEWSSSKARTHRFERSRGSSSSPVSIANSLSLPHLQLELEGDRGGEHVEARPEVGRGRGDRDEPPPDGHVALVVRDPERPAIAPTR